MAKRQIKISREDIRSLIKEELDALGNKRYPSGVFSTDSEEGQAFMDYANKLDREKDRYYDSKKDNYTIWDPYERKLKGDVPDVTGERWSDTLNSIWDSDEKRDRFARDEFGDKEREGKLYDKPFGDFDDTENLWHGDPSLEEPDDEEEIAGLDEKRQIRLNEEGLRKFISYSVARLLKENHPIYRSLGNGDYDYDGDEEDGTSKGGSVEIELSDESLMRALAEVAGAKFDDAYRRQYAEKYGAEPDVSDFIDDMMRTIGFDAYVRVNLDYDVTTDNGDYWTPGSSEAKLSSCEIDPRDERYANASDTGKKVMEVAARYMVEGNEDELYQQLNEGFCGEKENKGITAHFNGDGFKSKNPYENMTYDEYVDAKRKEREDDDRKKELHKFNYPEDGKPNRGATVHFQEGKKNVSNLTLEDLSSMVSGTVRKLMNEWFSGLPRSYDALRTRSPYDNDPYDMTGKPITEDDFMDMFYSSDDKDFMNWLKDFDQAVYQKALQSEESGEENAMNVALEELGWKEIATEYFDMKPVNYYPGDNDPDPREAMGLDEEMEDGAPQQGVEDRFPKKASGRFTMRTRRGNVDKYRVFVEKTDNGELLTDIFVYDEQGKEWEPQAEYVVGIEEYTNGSWLPYWESFNGDVSIRALANCFDKVVKLWKKVGYLYEEDDEIPFRYSGDHMKGAPKGMF